MFLRELKEKDAPLMLEWMHNKSVVEHLGTNFAEKTLEDCLNFIEASKTDKNNLNLAIADQNDEYMGTVSLKHIDYVSCTAEFAITMRSVAMGKGFSKYGMQSILEKGINEMGLKEIYWCVSEKNLRAIRFYDKYGYTRTNFVPQSITEFYSKENDFIWYIYK